MPAPIFLALFWMNLSAQILRPAPSTLQHVTIEAATSASSGGRGNTVTLWADVTPKPNIHVYAADWHGFTPVTLVITPHPALTIGKAKYPEPELSRTVGVDGPMAVYTKRFRVSQAVTVRSTAKRGQTLTIAGVVNYQACDDRVCYPATSLPVTWTLNVR